MYVCAYIYTHTQVYNMYIYTKNSPQLLFEHVAYGERIYIDVYVYIYMYWMYDGKYKCTLISGDVLLAADTRLKAMMTSNLRRRTWRLDFSFPMDIFLRKHRNIWEHHGNIIQ